MANRMSALLCSSLFVAALLFCLVAFSSPVAAQQQDRVWTYSYYPNLPQRFKAGIAVTVKQLTLNGAVYPAGSYITWGGPGLAFNDTLGEQNNNDVWASTDAKTWTCISGRYRTSRSGDWTNCQNPNNGLDITVGSTACSDPQGNLYLVGGENNVPGNPRRQTHNIVYVSTNGGITWFARSNTNLPARSYANCIMSSDKIFVMNGVLDYNDQEGDWRNPGNDIWSSNFGDTLMFSSVGNGGYAPRGAAMATSVTDNSMYHYPRVFYVMGGWSDFTNTSLNNDVYYSVDLGRTWTQATSRASWPSRADSEIVSTPRGFLALVGGRTQVGNNDWVIVNDVYLSADGGMSWYMRSGNFTGRIFPALTTSADKARLVVAFGANGQLMSDVQVSRLQLDDETGITMRYWGMRPNQVTSSCIGLFACKNELGFTPRSASAPWAARSRHSVHYTKDGSQMVLFGGMPTAASTNTWSSRDEGSSWSQLSSQGMPALIGACYHADTEDNLYITGGAPDGVQPQRTSHSFVSRNLGASWENRTSSSPSAWFPSRAWHNCLSGSDGTLYVLNGYGEAVLNDIYMSVDQGASWSLVTIGMYTPRAGSSVAVWRVKAFDLVYLVGGVGGYYDLPMDDVFYSTDGMKTWSVASLDAPWAARQDASLSVASNGVLVLTGGLQTLNNLRYYFNDVWVSFNGGANWAVIEDATYNQRAFGAAVFLKDSSLAMIGGYGSVYSATGALSFNDYNDVWVSQIKFTDVDSLKSMAEWEVADTCNAPASVCSSLSSSSSVSAGTVIGVLIAIPCGLFLIWALYSLRVHGEVRIPFTDRSCNCCNAALRRDTLFDDEYSLHKGTGKYKSSVNSTASHRLMDD